MSWITLTIKTDDAFAEPISEALLEQGSLSVEINDADAGTAEEQALYGEPGEPSEQFWQRTEVTGLFEQGADVEAIMKTVADAVHLSDVPGFRVDTVEEQDWVRQTQSQFNPIQISQRLWIVPTWHQPPDSSAINLILDPGLAFGTGSHPTTQLCLSWLDQHLQHDQTILDYGCGSGILAIAALKLGASYVTGIDIDPQAINASHANAKLNACNPEQFYFATDYQMTDQQSSLAVQFDIVIANILSNPLIILAPILAQATRHGGQIVLSGILRDQAQEVTAVYQQWFGMKTTNVMEDWVLLTGIKK